MGRNLGTVVELVDTPDLKSVEHHAREGSSPSRPIGKVVEWFKALVLKTSDVKASVGSNPTLSVL